MLSADGLTVESLTVRRGERVVLDEVSFSLPPGKTLAVIGESGAGKSTLVGAVLGLVHSHIGSIKWQGAPLSSIRPALVMQEPRAAYNPAQTLSRSVMEPLTARRAIPDPDRLKRLCAGLEFDPALLERRPHQISIGQAQRVGILRALMSASPLVLFDEPLSALDAVTQKHTAQLISQLQAEEGFAALIVTHDLGYAAAHADDIVILRDGQVEEAGTAKAFFQSPKTDYGRALCDAAFELGALERAA